MIEKTYSFSRILFCVVIVCALLLIAWEFHQYSLDIIQWIDQLGWLAPVLFLGLYCLATLMLLPTMILTLAGGALFGPFFGTILNLVGATLGAAFAFLITRHLVYEWFSQHKGKKLEKLIAGVDEKGWLFVAFLRLFPVIPFNLVNYGLGITGIKFRLYLVTTFIFLIPAEIIYTYFGYAGMDALSSPAHFYQKGGIILTVIAFCFLILLFLIKRRSQLTKRKAKDEFYRVEDEPS
jgi:uncharacterized membrane protein YdjX (TVP38/TMEM64 family)